MRCRDAKLSKMYIKDKVMLLRVDFMATVEQHLTLKSLGWGCAVSVSDNNKVGKLSEKKCHCRCLTGHDPKVYLG